MKLRHVTGPALVAGIACAALTALPSAASAAGTMNCASGHLCVWDGTNFGLNKETPLVFTPTAGKWLIPDLSKYKFSTGVSATKTISSAKNETDRFLTLCTNTGGNDGTGNDKCQTLSPGAEIGTLYYNNQTQSIQG